MVEAQTKVLEAKGIKRHYSVKGSFGKKRSVKALDGVSFSLNRKETLAIVGESGCGKSTLAKVLMQIEPLDEGELWLQGRPHSANSVHRTSNQIQMIFQDPYSSINPRKKAWKIVGEPLIVNSKSSRHEVRKAVEELMGQVGLGPEYMERYPHMFSGGQRQRLGIARAVILRPDIIVCDEPVSALDISIQAQVINLLLELQERLGLSYVFISHDLSVVSHVAHQILVMYLGKSVEYGPREAILKNPLHPYTQILLESSPSIHSRKEKSLSLIKGELPSPLNPPQGCAFHTRCPKAQGICHSEVPGSRMVEGRWVACHFPEKKERG